MACSPGWASTGPPSWRRSTGRWPVPFWSSRSPCWPPRPSPSGWGDATWIDPIRQLAEAARRWREGDLSARTTVTPGDLAPLAVAFNAMAAALEAREDERRRAEEALAESERRYRFMADSVPQIVWTADPDGALDFIGARMAEYAGVGDVQRFLSMGWTDLLHPEDLPDTLAAWDEARRAGGDLEIEHRLRRHDGTYRWHPVRALPLRAP